MKLKVTTDQLRIGDRFKLRDEVTRSQNVYEITSNVTPITSNPHFSHFVECDCKEIIKKPHKQDCKCGGCDEVFDKMMWISGEVVSIER